MNIWREELLIFEGPYSAWTDDDELMAEVRDERGKVIKKFKGETAWSDSVRMAGDLNLAYTMKEK